VYWDRAFAIRQDSRSFAKQPASAIITDLVAHAQDTAVGKDDLNIDVAGTTTATYSRTYLYSDHQNVWQAIKELGGHTDGPDVRLDITDTTRALSLHEPRLVEGTPFATLTGGRGAGGTPRTVEIASYSLSVDWSRQHTAAVALGAEGAGSDREEGGYVGAGTPVTEVALTATIETPSGDLARWAQGQTSPLVSAFEVTVVPTTGTDLLAAIRAGIFRAGDVVTIDLRDELGVVVVDGDWQAVTIRMHGIDETLTLTLNQVP
jgi:hypothetical protein